MTSQTQQLPSGPLTAYRKRATFEWTKLQKFLYPNIQHRNQVYKILQQDSLFHMDLEEELGRMQLRERAYKQVRRIMELGLVDDVLHDEMKAVDTITCLFDAHVLGATPITLHNLFCNTVER